MLRSSCTLILLPYTPHIYFIHSHALFHWFLFRIFPLNFSSRIACFFKHSHWLKIIVWKLASFSTLAGSFILFFWLFYNFMNDSSAQKFLITLKLCFRNYIINHKTYRLFSIDLISLYPFILQDFFCSMVSFILRI